MLSNFSTATTTTNYTQSRDTDSRGKFRLLAKKIEATNVASAYVLGEPKDQRQRPHTESVISAVRRSTH
jgi:hypothetical protein